MLRVNIIFTHVFFSPPPFLVLYNAGVMQDLLAPMPVNHFFQDYYMKEPVHIRRATAAHAPLFKHLFSVEDLDELLEKGGGEPSISRALALKSSNGSTIEHMLPPPGHPSPSGGGYTARRLLANGTTIRFNLEKIESQHLPLETRNVLDALNVMLGGTNSTNKEDVRSEGNALAGVDLRTGIHVYATGPLKGARGLKPHTDPYDVFIVQLEGRKKWTVCTPVPKLINAAASEHVQPSTSAPPWTAADDVAGSAVPALSSAEKAELHLQDQHKSGQCTFYTDESLEELDCFEVMLVAGDKYYMPKGLVHYAESTGAISMHATISFDRNRATWFDLVLDELHRKQVAGGGSSIEWDADLLLQHVESTLLGVLLAQLVPVGAAALLPGWSRGRDSPDTASTNLALEPVLRQYLHDLVAEVDRLTQGSDAHHGGGGGGGDDGLSVAARIGKLKRASIRRKGGDAHVARERRAGTDYGDKVCDNDCDDACNLFGFSCDSSCDSACSCNPGHDATSVAYGTSCECDGCDAFRTYDDGSKSSSKIDSCDSSCGCDSTSVEGKTCPKCSATTYKPTRGNTGCIDCTNAVCPETRYRSGTCGETGNGFACNVCANLDCSTQGEHMYRAGTCGGQTTPTVNGYTCDTHEPCPDKDTYYVPSDYTHRTCIPCTAGQHQPFAKHRERNCIDTTTTSTTTTTTTTTSTTLTTTTTTSSATTTTLNATELNRLQSLNSKPKSSIPSIVAVVVAALLLLGGIGLAVVFKTKKKQQQQQQQRRTQAARREARQTTVSNSGFQGMPAPALPLEESDGAHNSGGGDSDGDDAGDGDCGGYLSVAGADSANANLAGTRWRLQQKQVPYGSGGEVPVRGGTIEQPISATRVITDNGAYLQSSSVQAVRYDAGVVPGIAGNQLPVYAEVDDDEHRDAVQVHATAMQRCKYRQAGEGGQRCKSTTTAKWCEKHACGTPACQNSKSSKSAVCSPCFDSAQVGGTMYAARSDSALRVGVDGGVFYATRNESHDSSTGAEGGGRGIKRNRNRTGSVYLGFDEGSETSTM